MAIREVEGTFITDVDHEHQPAAADAELRLGPGVTFSCIRDNSKSPTAKIVKVLMWAEQGKFLSFCDHWLPSGSQRSTSLVPFGVKVVTFEVLWQIPSTGSLMSGTTGKVHAPNGKYFLVFGVSWDQNDLYSLIQVTS